MLQNVILECGSVRLVPFSQADLNAVRELHSDKDVVDCLVDEGQPKASNFASRFLADAEESTRKHGFSRWKALTSDGLFVGWAGFSAFEETSEIGLCYCYEAEAIKETPELPAQMCKALANWFFENTYFSHLVAMVRTDNKSARDNLHASGFGYRESRQISGMPCDLFQLFSPSMQTYVLSA